MKVTIPKHIQEGLEKKIFCEFANLGIGNDKLTKHFLNKIIIDILDLESAYYNPINRLIRKRLKGKNNGIRKLDFDDCIKELFRKEYALTRGLSKTDTSYLLKKFLACEIVTSEDDFINTFLQEDIQTQNDSSININNKTTVFITACEIQKQISNAELVALFNHNINHLTFPLDHINDLLINQRINADVPLDDCNMFFIRLPNKTIKLFKERIGYPNNTRVIRIERLYGNGNEGPESPESSEYINPGSTLYLPI